MPEEEIPRNRSVGIVIILLFIFVIYFYQAYLAGSLISLQDFASSIKKDWVDTLVFILLTGPLFYITYLIA
ncbi:MAG: hypothetical protein QXH95_04685, partial [Thermoplasmata archaeon]